MSIVRLFFAVFVLFPNQECKRQIKKPRKRKAYQRLAQRREKGENTIESEVVQCLEFS